MRYYILLAFFCAPDEVLSSRHSIQYDFDFALGTPFLSIMNSKSTKQTVMNCHYACWAGHIEEETFKECVINTASDVKPRLQCAVEISLLNSKAQFYAIGVFMLAIVNLKCQTLRFYGHAHFQSFQYNVRERHRREERVVGNPSIVCGCAVWVCGVRCGCVGVRVCGVGFCGVCLWCVCGCVRCVFVRLCLCVCAVCG